MERRQFITAGMAATGAIGLLGSQAFAADAAPTGGKNTPNSKADANSLQTALAHCLQTGNACVAHCMSELSQGNKSMGECNKTVQEMLASCEALLKLSSYKSDLTKDMAKICAQACDNCAAACKKHSAHWEHGMHLACKDCYEACLECSKQCKAV